MAILDCDYVRGLYAVYTGTNDAPLVDPLNNLPRVKFHAALRYLGAQKISTTVDLRPGTWTTAPNIKQSLGPHGKAFVPLVLAVVWIDGKPVPAHAPFLVLGRYENLIFDVYADATNIYISLAGDMDSDDARPTIASVPIDLYVCNMGVTAAGAAVFPPTVNNFDATPTRLRVGQFDSNDLHFAVNATGPVSFYRGKSIEIEVAGNCLGVWQSVNGYAVSAIQGRSYLESTIFTATTTRTVAK